MERYPVFMDGIIDIVKCLCYPKPLSMQCNSYQDYNGVFYEVEKKNPKICMEAQNTFNSQSNNPEEEQSWRHHYS